jgi:branched-chain amino acid transport system permease protein
MVTKTIGTIDYRKEVAVLRHSGQWIILIISLAVLGLLPNILQWTGNANWFTFINVTFITIIAVLGLNIITGMAGQVSLGHAAFIMVGAYTTGILIKEFSWSFWATVPVSALLTAIIGMIVGAPSLRLKGFYLAVATLAFFLIAQFIIRNLSFSGGTIGLIGVDSPTIGSLIISSETAWYYLILIFTLAFIFFSINLTRSKLGRAFFAVRDNANTAASMGIPSYTTKLRAFFIGSLFAGVAGSLLAGYMTVVRLEMFNLWDSIWYLGMIVIGGAGSTAGTIMGVIFLRLISQVMQLLSMSDILPSAGGNLWVFITSGIYGLIIVLFVSFQPYGLIDLWRKINYKLKNIRGQNALLIRKGKG